MPWPARWPCGDPPAAARRLCELLWHVEAQDSGFIGLSDDQLLEKCENDQRLNYATATDVMHAPGPWPICERN